MRKIKKGDKVQILAGKDKGRIGTVQQVLVRTKKVKRGQLKTTRTERNQHTMVLVDGANQLTHFVKGNPQTQQPGGLIKKEAPIAISNVALIDPTTNKPSKVGIKTLEDGKKVRFFKASGEVVDA